MTLKYSEIDEVITYVLQNLYEPLSLAQLARHISYSPYHFSRIFKERTGLSPLYYVSSLRLQKAKDLLLHSHFSVRDIALEIGQQSLGTFTTRFTERVGVTPAQFRDSRQAVEQHLQSLQQLNHWLSAAHFSQNDCKVEGSIHSELPFNGFILIGLFAKPIPEGLPLYGTLLSSLGEFCFTGVEPGTYYLMATSVSWGMQATDILLPQATLRARIIEPIIVTPYSTVPYQQLILHPPRLDDPPILISLPLLMNHFLSRVSQT
ncbi:helix-turn-helix transcriptional regulator [Caldalkalibacillus mannanilyticus]|uniref:helix-turn-helix transcriptional regulator n=1 Tax=Caldalkalibacillus mannanilyticus TaxID=1418 RepID=UPI000469F620|nr:helix-turn-helix transcriptional regulator [Caldalkalibacillus mannanilyticus]